VRNIKKKSSERNFLFSTVSRLNIDILKEKDQMERKQKIFWKNKDLFFCSIAE